MTSRASVFLAFIRTIRPHQWAKNALIFAPLLFAQKLTDVSALLLSTAAFSVFCMLAGSIYILNDLLDVEKDRLHPKKRFRPIASGDFPPETAKWAWWAMALCALSAASLLRPAFAGIALTYLLINIGYCLRLKHIPYLDVLCVSSGFMLRVMAGGEVTQLPLSKWLLLCTLLLALYLALGKRRHELASYDGQAARQRKVLEHYNVKQLDLMLGIVASLATLGYCGYTLDPTTQQRFGTPNLIYTLPFVVFGIVRFLQLVGYDAKTESPTQELLRDIPSLLNVVCWVITVISIIY